MIQRNKHILECFTIGHSDHNIENFIYLLEQHKINCLIDVRSMPYSQRVAQFNKEVLLTDLKKNSILYMYLGNRLGGRYTNPELLFPNGKVNYEKVKDTKNFIMGIEKVIQGIKKGYKLALMCSEGNPFDCHRFLLVSIELEKKGVVVKHILEDGKVILNSELEKKLLSKYKENYRQLSFLEHAKTREEALEDARRKRNIAIAFSASEYKK